MKKVSKLIVLLVVLEYIKLIKIILILYPIQTIFIMMNVNMFFFNKNFSNKYIDKDWKIISPSEHIEYHNNRLPKRFYTY